MSILWNIRYNIYIIQQHSSSYFQHVRRVRSCSPIFIRNYKWQYRHIRLCSQCSLQQTGISMFSTYNRKANNIFLLLIYVGRFPSYKFIFLLNKQINFRTQSKDQSRQKIKTRSISTKITPVLTPKLNPKLNLVGHSSFKY